MSDMNILAAIAGAITKHPGGGANVKRVMMGVNAIHRLHAAIGMTLPLPTRAQFDAMDEETRKFAQVNWAGPIAKVMGKEFYYDPRLPDDEWHLEDSDTPSWPPKRAPEIEEAFDRLRDLYREDGGE
jgi:hypothetical protein